MTGVKLLSGTSVAFKPPSVQCTGDTELDGIRWGYSDYPAITHTSPQQFSQFFSGGGEGGGVLGSLKSKYLNNF